MGFPRWHYFPVNEPAPEWVRDFVTVVAAAEASISSEEKNGPKSDVVLEHLRPGLEGLGYGVETGKSSSALIDRPVLFGEGGAATITYKIDAYNPDHRIVVEVEAGRGVMSNAGFRDLLRTSLIADADYLAMLIPVSYRSAGTTTKGYEPLVDFLHAVHASGRLRLPFTGVLLVGY